MQFQSQVLSNVEVSPGYFRMRMTAPPAVLESSAGQFVMVKVSRAIDPLLRRPFGIYDMGTFVTPYTDSGRQTFLEILYKVVGRGTGMLADRWWPGRPVATSGDEWWRRGCGTGDAKNFFDAPLGHGPFGVATGGCARCRGLAPG